MTDHVPSPPRSASRHSAGERVAAGILWLIVLLCCGVPLAWLLAQIAIHPHVLADAIPDRFRLWLIVRTFSFSALAALLATAIAVPIGIAISGSRQLPARLLGLLVSVPLLMPSLVITYGWKQAYALAGVDPMPQSAADVVRCIVALASWVWPVPALVLAFALRRIDPNVMLHARLDGAHHRILARLAAGPMLLGFLGAVLLSLQEFAIFEPSGISVIATEVRAVFETGASLDQQWSIITNEEQGRGPTQEERTGAALAVMLPSLLATAILAAVLVRWASWLTNDIEWHTADEPRRATRARNSPLLVGYVAFLIAFGTPIFAMIYSMRTRFDPARIINDYWPQLAGSATLALVAAGVGLVLLVIASSIRISTYATGLALASFLVGGQWAAIALIVIFNRPWLAMLYDSSTMPILAYVGRFAWMPLCAAAITWSPGTRWLRELAATDGAGRWVTWRYVIAPLTWPLLGGAAMLVFTLSLTEVPATTLLQPAQTLVPMLMTWAHILNYDAMIEASLLLALIVMMTGLAAGLLVRTGARWMR